MELRKSYDFFKPSDLKGERVHIIGCGAVGGVVAENLVRFGINDITLWDFDTVEPKNIANQIYRDKDIGKSKIDALEDILFEINPDITGLRKNPNGWHPDDSLSGYVFLCVDNIDLRREICEENRYNTDIIAVFDFRMALTSAQCYAADWSDNQQKKDLLKSMNFSHDEASEDVPMSACHEVLSICPTIRVSVGLGVMNFINFVKGRGLKKLILTDMESLTSESF